jgi:hypothetical protein
MIRNYGIATAVAGLLVTVLSILKVVPLTGTGITLLLLGVLLVGLSFIPKPISDDSQPMSTLETITNIFLSPAEVFQNLRRHPRFLIVLLIGAIFSSIYISAFHNRVSTERIVNFTIDKTKDMPFMNDEARAQIEKGRADEIERNKNPLVRVGEAVNGFAGLVFGAAFLALIFWLAIMILGGSINYWQALSVAAYSLFPVMIIRYLLSLVILFIKDPAEIHPILGQSSLAQDNLGVLISPAENPVLYVLLTSISLLGFYWIWLNATGLKNAGERVSSGNAWAVTLGVWLVGVAFGAVMALVFPSFLS